MPVAIDTSVLISAEKLGDFEKLLPNDDGPYYIPAHASLGRVAKAAKGWK